MQIEAGAVYIVYAYCPDLSPSNPTKWILGTYFTIEEARERQHNFDESSYRISPGVYRSVNNYVSFINRLPIGHSRIELFTTKVE